MKSADAQTEFFIERFSAEVVQHELTDVLAVEEPLEIRLGVFEDGKIAHRNVSITMRTPGNDDELAAGFLFTEGILQNREQIADIVHCGKSPKMNLPSNTVRVNLQKDATVDFARLSRNFYTTSSCGVCGKSSLDFLAINAAPFTNLKSPLINAEVIHQLPQKQREAQEVFEETGGLHAAALFDVEGNLLVLREDVGRHNAVDKLIGRCFLDGKIPLEDSILMLSGRASFELVQKALAARIPVIAAVGAPSSLAVEAAREFGITLCGFVRNNKFNVYSVAERIAV
ncbi:MAG TPA: formate dehydrogenase accessory sulfurtransferase FdhD [Pyrinomonadaceae bacterium]|nr:formate dehydrogenase accessory sulfurtransferase FdhD [Pyrinomonadaceae bacterium]